MKAVTELLDLFKGREVPVVEELPTADRPENGEKQPRNVDEKGHPEAEGESLSSDAQIGVKKIEATTKVWSKRSLIAAYIFIWFLYLVDSMQQGMSNSLLPYVTSSFQLHSLTAATSIMSNIIGGLSKLPLAKILDVWGRPQGFAIMMCFLTLGLIMMAACNNVKTYAAAQVFYWVGYNGMDYSLSIFIADTSSLKNRSFMFAFVSSPYIATTWIGGPLATAFLKGPGFRWGYGAFAVITPVVSLPLIGLFVYNYREAKKAGLMPMEESGRTVPQSLWYYTIQFDLAGLILICAGLALFLLPFSLYSYQSDGWRSPMIICMIIFGGLLLIAFALYERYLAPVPFIPYGLLMDRTVIGACILAAILFVAFYIWDNYFTSFLQVVNGLTVAEASYVANIYSVGSCFWSLLVGVYIRWTGKFKNLALFFGLPLIMLGVGLMIHFRQPNHNVGYIVMCQIFHAFAGGTLVICEQMAVMAAASHQQVAVVLAVEGMFSSVGGAVGSTVAAAIWTGVFPKKLAEYLPASAQPNLLTIYEDLVTQLSYPKGSAARAAIDRAYGAAQKDMLIASVSVLSLAFVAVAVWRNYNVKEVKQTKGRVF